mgnify:CR=1 FL=1
MRLILSGIIIVISFNIALALRDSKILNQIEERNQIIYEQLEK